jgi:hypothetical protein
VADVLELKGDAFHIPSTYQRDEAARNVEVDSTAGATKSEGVEWIAEAVLRGELGLGGLASYIGPQEKTEEVAAIEGVAWTAEISWSFGFPKLNPPRRRGCHPRLLSPDSLLLTLHSLLPTASSLLILHTSLLTFTCCHQPPSLLDFSSSLFLIDNMSIFVYMYMYNNKREDINAKADYHGSKKQIHETSRRSRKR